MPLLLSLVAIPVVLIWAYLRWVWRGCGIAWNARQPDPDPLAWVFRIRDIAALVIVIAAALYWRWGRIDANEQFTRITSDYVVTAAVLLVIVIAVAIVFGAIAERGFRLHAIANASIPLFAVTTSVLIFAIPALLFFLPGAPGTALFTLISEALRHWALVENGGEFWPGTALFFWEAFCIVGGLAAGLGALTAMIAAIWMGVRSRFRVGDAHPFMAATVSVALAGWAIWRGVSSAAGSADGEYPWWAMWVLTFAGPILVIGLSVWQIVRLHRHGIRFRRPFFDYADDPVSRRVGSAAYRVHGAVLARASRRSPET